MVRHLRVARIIGDIIDKFVYVQQAISTGSIAVDNAASLTLARDNPTENYSSAVITRHRTPQKTYVCVHSMSFSSNLGTGLICVRGTTLTVTMVSELICPRPKPLLGNLFNSPNAQAGNRGYV